jgi:hypothetical protein
MNTTPGRSSGSLANEMPSQFPSDKYLAHLLKLTAAGLLEIFTRFPFIHPPFQGRQNRCDYKDSRLFCKKKSDCGEQHTHGIITSSFAEVSP